MEPEKTQLIFVYNADSGVFNLLGDMAHKIFSPQTYNCNLCALTHGNFGMKNEWREFLETLPVPFEFLHADEFKARYETSEHVFPAVYKKETGAPRLVIDHAALNEFRTIDELKRAVAAEVENILSGTKS